MIAAMANISLRDVILKVRAALGADDFELFRAASLSENITIHRGRSLEAEVNRIVGLLTPSLSDEELQELLDASETREREQELRAAFADA